MTPLNYVILFFCGVLGILLHVFAVKIPATKQRAQVANMTFTFSGYLKDEAAALISSLISIVILLFVLNEIVAFKPEVTPYLRAAFVFVGYTGSSIILAIMGKASDKINSIVNIKTNIADDVSPPPPPPPTV